MARWLWKNALQDDMEPLLAAADARMAAMYAAINAAVPLVAYDAGGAQRAVTTVTQPPTPPVQYGTYEQMHAEMRALGASVPPWSMNAVGQIEDAAAAAIPVGNYWTDLPHCGYCTIMLHVLNLPFSTAPPAPGGAAPTVGPTRGRFNAAVNLGYPLPDFVKNNLNVLASLYVTAALPGVVAIKHVMNAFLGNPSAGWELQIPGPLWVSDIAVLPAASVNQVLPLDDFMSHMLTVNGYQHFGTDTGRNMLWKIIWRALYNNCE